MEDKLFSVYTLSDPRTGLVRYVGISCNVEQRYIAHCQSDPNNATKKAWIKELKDNQLLPALAIIETGLTFEDAKKHELDWIQHHLEIGMPLVNISGVTAPWVGGIRTKSILSERQIPQEDRLLTIKEVVEILDCTRDTVLYRIKAGKIPAYHTGTWLVKQSDLDAYIEKRKYKPEETK